MTERVSHEAIMDELRQGAARFVSIEKQLADIAEAVKPIPQMQADIAETRELVEAWGAVKLAGRFVKWASGLAGGLAVIWAAIKVGLGVWR